jgi:hypothetical protein
MTDQATDQQTKRAAETTDRQRRLYTTQLVLFVGTLMLTLICRVQLNGDAAFFALVGGMAAMAIVKCPGCGKLIMIYRGTLFPRRACTHCSWPHSETPKRTVDLPD